MHLQSTLARREAEVIEIDPDALPPRELERRHEVAVASDDHDCRDHLAQSQAREIESDTQIDSLLLDAGLEGGSHPAMRQVGCTDTSPMRSAKSGCISIFSCKDVAQR